MQSKTSFFNRTLFRKNLTRFWPLWAMPSFVGALFPMVALTQGLRHGMRGLIAADITAAYYEVVSYAVPILSLCYAVLVAIAVWSYLFNGRSTGLMHTLPIRREGLFLTGLLSGMAMLLIPYAVTGLLSIVIFACFGLFNPTGILVTILCIAGESLFYFGSATLVAFVTGNLFAMPVLYFILHFLAALMDFLVNAFSTGFLFGVQGDYSGAVEFLSPTVYLLSHVRCDRIYEEHFDAIGKYHYNELIGATLRNGWVIAAYAAVGAVLLVLAYVLYRRRRSESAGDVVSVGWMKPVFRYGVAVCGSMAGGLLLYTVFWSSFQDGNYYDLIPLMVCMLLAGAISYYAASMLLAKSLRVFRGNWKGLLVTVLISAAICGTLHFDLLGVETRVPTADQIDYMSLYVADNNYTLYPEEDAELIEGIRAVHLAIAEDADYIVAMQENRQSTLKESGDDPDIVFGTSVRLQYYLENGTRVIRRYSVPMVRTRTREAGTYDHLLDTLVNSDLMKAERFHLDGAYRPENGYIYPEASNAGGISFGNREAEAVMAAVERDIAAGTCGVYDWFEAYRGNDYAMDLNVDFLKETRSETGKIQNQYDTIHIRVTPAMTHTVAVLLELELVDQSALKTRAELWPQDYDLAYLEYQKYHGYVEYDVFQKLALSSARGIIGGADGPTEIVVAEPAAIPAEAS